MAWRLGPSLPYLIFFGIFGTGFLLRSALFFNSSAEVLRAAAEVESIACRLANEGRFADPYCIPTGATCHAPPLYPIFLAGIYKVFGCGAAGNTVKVFVNIFASSLVWALLPRMAELLRLGRMAGLIAGLLGALLPMRMSVEVSLGGEVPLAALLTMYEVSLLCRFPQRKAWTAADALFTGLRYGLAFLLAPQLLLLFLAFLVLRLYLQRDAGQPLFPNPPAQARWYAVCLLTIALTLAPWTYRNYAAFGKVFFVRCNFPLELYISNSPGTSPLTDTNNLMSTQHPFLAVAEARTVRDLGEIEYHRQKLDAAKDWIRQNPAAFASLTVRRFYLFWLGAGKGAVLSLARGAISVGALLGMALALWRVRRDRGGPEARALMILLTMWCVYPAPYYLVQVITRYRYIMEWSLYLMLGFLLHALWEMSRERFQLIQSPPAAL